MDNLKIGDKVGLSWIQGHGNAKVVGIYEDWIILIHYCFGQVPHIIHKSRLEPPECLNTDCGICWKCLEPVPPEPKEPEIDYYHPRVYCSWIFGSPECNYKGKVLRETICYKTFDDCKAKGNEARFGGFPPIKKVERFLTAEQITEMILHDIHSQGPIRAAIKRI